MGWRRSGGRQMVAAVRRVSEDAPIVGILTLSAVKAPTWVRTTEDFHGYLDEARKRWQRDRDCMVFGLGFAAASLIVTAFALATR